MVGKNVGKKLEFNIRNYIIYLIIFAVVGTILDGIKGLLLAFEIMILFLVVTMVEIWIRNK